MPVGDAAATLTRSAPMLPRIRALGYPAALVAQDGLEHLAVPWDAFDVLFLGGTTDWKLGPAAADLPADAVWRSTWDGFPGHFPRVPHCGQEVRRLRSCALHCRVSCLYRPWP